MSLLIYVVQTVNARIQQVSLTVTLEPEQINQEYDFYYTGEGNNYVDCLEPPPESVFDVKSRKEHDDDRGCLEVLSVHKVVLLLVVEKPLRDQLVGDVDQASCLEDRNDVVDHEHFGETYRSFSV